MDVKCVYVVYVVLFYLLIFFTEGEKVERGKRRGKERKKERGSEEEAEDTNRRSFIRKVKHR